MKTVALLLLPSLMLVRLVPNFPLNSLCLINIDEPIGSYNFIQTLKWNNR
ncbi:hypothetical protein LINGRAPRIM_LOCUS3065, partial [Linum grandiflorum]